MSRSNPNISFDFSDAKLDNKAIPSKVFFNHFDAINFHLNEDNYKFQLKNLDFYNKLKINNSKFNLDECRKLIWNSWSTEYAFNLASSIDNLDFYKFALHWHFPQAYYSIYLSMTVFHKTQGLANDQHEKSIKIFGNSIKDGHYPKAISFYCKGFYNDFSYNGLNLFNGFPKDFSPLSRIYSNEDSQIQIANFLKSTREKNAENKKNRGVASHTKDPRFQNRKGELTKRFTKEHWNLIYSSIPETTILNIMYRLRIKANYYDIETFINADIDFIKFHQFLGNIIYYMNFVHEAYLHKCIGDLNYKKILTDFKGHLNNDRALNRYDLYISKF
jgi:hypothetical protein